jgi:hypothetical protein
MFQRKLFIILPFVLAGGALAASDAQPGDDVRFWDAAGPIVPLEKANLVPVAASPGGTASWEIRGAKSAMRIKRNAALLFLARIPEGADPAKIQLFRLNYGAVRKPYPAGDSWRTATLSVTKAGDAYGLAPVGELNEGEYAFIRAGSNQAYCFGIDPAS